MRKFLCRLFGIGYSIEEIRLAFEYGLTIATTAQEMKFELTPEVVKRAEVMIEGEFSRQSPTHLAGNMVPNVMSAFNLDVTE